MPNTPENIVNCRDWATIRYAFDHTGSTHDITASGCPGDVNLSGIFTHIIQLTGRFAESYASDVLLELDNIRTLVNMPFDSGPSEDIDVIIPLGIRRQGVDHAAFLMRRLLQTCQPSLLGSYVYPEHAYRAILACRIQIQYSNNIRPYITCTLRSIMDSIVRIMPADMDGDKLVEQG